MKISIVIPTLNEEHYLPKLLESIKRQKFKDYEIIVADAGSKDKTAKIAKEYGAKVVKGGLPAVGRNNGAYAAKGDFIFFFDADVILPKDFLEKAYNEMQRKYLDLATCEASPISNQAIDKITHNFVNVYIKMSQLYDPHAGGFCILVSKRLFDRIGGFDETLKMAEDHEFVKRASKFRQLTVLNSTYVNISIRRFRKEGRFELAKKYLQTDLYRIFVGEIRKDILKYEFGNFDNKRKKVKIDRNLMEIEKKINSLNRKYKEFAGKYLRPGKIAKGYKEGVVKLKKEFNKLNTSFGNLFIKNRKS